MSSVIQLMRQVEQLTEAGIALSAERNIDQLLNRSLHIIQAEIEKVEKKQ